MPVVRSQDAIRKKKSAVEARRLSGLEVSRSDCGRAACPLFTGRGARERSNMILMILAEAPEAQQGDDAGVMIEMRRVEVSVIGSGSRL